jgi:hypothetical protein
MTTLRFERQNITKKLNYSRDSFKKIFFISLFGGKNKTPRLFLTQQPIEAIYAVQQHTT